MSKASHNNLYAPLLQGELIDTLPNVTTLSQSSGYT